MEIVVVLNVIQGTQFSLGTPVLVAGLGVVIGQETVQKRFEGHERPLRRHRGGGYERRTLLSQMLVPKVCALVWPRRSELVLIGRHKSRERISYNNEFAHSGVGKTLDSELSREPLEAL